MHTHHHAFVNGVRLHYVEAGTGPLVVLLHGFPEFWYSWRHQIPALAAAGYRVIAPDLRGYNLSEKPAGVNQYRVGILVDDVIGLIRHADADRAALIGHDWGGGIAWAAAWRHPEVVERLVTLNAPHPLAFRRELRTWRQLRRSWYMFYFRLPWLPEWTLRARDFGALRRLLAADPRRRDAFSAADIEQYVDALRQPGALTATLNYYRALFRRWPRWARRRAGVLEAPTLIIWGEHDRFLGPGLLRGLEQWVPDLRIERLPEASHWVQVDAPERVNQLILDFLREPPSGGTKGPRPRAQ